MSENPDMGHPALLPLSPGPPAYEAGPNFISTIPSNDNSFAKQSSRDFAPALRDGALAGTLTPSFAALHPGLLSCFPSGKRKGPVGWDLWFPPFPQKKRKGWGTADSRFKCNSASFRRVRRWQNKAMEKMENKERFPLSHGTATVIYLNLFTNVVALGL